VPKDVKFVVFQKLNSITLYVVDNLGSTEATIIQVRAHQNSDGRGRLVSVLLR
jgi:hypothetical protein